MEVCPTAVGTPLLTVEDREGWKRFALVLDVLERKGARICRQSRWARPGRCLYCNRSSSALVRTEKGQLFDVEHIFGFRDRHKELDIEA